MGLQSFDCLPLPCARDAMSCHPSLGMHVGGEGFRATLAFGCILASVWLGLRPRHRNHAWLACACLAPVVVAPPVVSRSPPASGFCGEGMRFACRPGRRNRMPMLRCVLLGAGPGHDIVGHRQRSGVALCIRPHVGPPGDRRHARPRQRTPAASLRPLCRSLVALARRVPVCCWPHGTRMHCRWTGWLVPQFLHTGTVAASSLFGQAAEMAG